MLPVGLH